jgi:hypothetical protein
MSTIQTLTIIIALLVVSCVMVSKKRNTEGVFFIVVILFLYTFGFQIKLTGVNLYNSYFKMP